MYLGWLLDWTQNSSSSYCCIGPKLCRDQRPQQHLMDCKSWWNRASTMCCDIYVSLKMKNEMPCKYLNQHSVAITFHPHISSLSQYNSLHCREISPCLCPNGNNPAWSDDPSWKDNPPRRLAGTWPCRHVKVCILSIKTTVILIKVLFYKILFHIESLIVNWFWIFIIL